METKLGKEATLKASFVEGKVRLQIDQSGTLGDAGAYIQTSPAQLRQALADLIPGDSTAEHMALGVVETALELGAKAL